MSETATTRSVVTVSRERDGVALIHLNRPPANSYNRVFLDDLNAAIDEVRWDGDLRGAVLVSDLAPRFFSAGADITNFQKSTQQERVMTVLHAQEILLKIERTPKIFVAAISGHALGGGLEIALACDFRFAAEGDFRLGLPEVTLGLLPGNGGTQRLTRLVGRTRALDMMITNQQINTARALEIGLVSRVFPAERLMDEAVAYVASLAGGPSLAIGNIKIATRLGADLPGPPIRAVGDRFSHDARMTVAKSITLFLLAAIAGIGGAWLIWQGAREHRGVAWIGSGIGARAAAGSGSASGSIAAPHRTS